MQCTFCFYAFSLQVQSDKIYIAGGEYFGDASTENSLLLSRVGTSTFFQGNVKLTSGAKYHYTVTNGVGQYNHQLARIKCDAGTDAGCSALLLQGETEHHTSVFSMRCPASANVRSTDHMLRTFEQPDGSSRGHTEPRLLRRCFQL